MSRSGRERFLMFPLFRKQMPADAGELEKALNQSCARLFARVTNPVSIRGEQFPQLAAIQLQLDGAELRANPPRPPGLRDSSIPALQVAQLNINGNRMTVGPAAGVNLRLRATDVRLSEGRDSADEIVLLLQSAQEGEIAISVEQAELERAIANVAREQAAKHGVAIEQVQLAANARGDRGLAAEVQLRAKKLFFSTTVRVAAKLELDENLSARLSGLTCNAEGAIGAVACGVLQPQLEKLEGRSFSLMALPLGEVRLRDVRIATGSEIKITAEFGS